MKLKVPVGVLCGLVFVLGQLSAGVKEFEAWPEDKSPTVIGRRVAEQFIALPHFNWGRRSPPTVIYYPEVCTWYGALGFAKAAGQPDLTAALVKRFEPLLGERSRQIPGVTEVDFAVFGALPLEIAIQTGDQRCLELGLRIARQQWAAPNEKELDHLKPEPRAIAVQAYYEDGLTWHTRYWIDDMYMITLVQAQAARASGEPEFIDRTARLMVAYLDKLQDANGLFPHAPDVPFFWGRGNGWFAAGMTELLRTMPEQHPLRPRVLAGYRAMMAALLKYQAEDGMWRQLIDRPESWPETSCTGMFTFAFVEGVKNGWLDQATYAPAARKAWLRVTDYLDEQAGLREVCVGTNKENDYQFYMDRPRTTGDLHGQAPLLWTATALLR
jgi:unsaturated rhamnogalacturonyl hydrolase